MSLCSGFRAKWLPLLLIALLLPAAPLPAKSIRLRAGTIETGEPRRVAAGVSQSAAPAPGDDLPASGLYLVQFAAPATPDQLAELETSGARILQYLPEDTYLVRLRQAPLRSVKSVSQFHWLGRYQPEHKLEPSLQARLRNAASPLANVAVLLAPDPTPEEAAVARRFLGSLRQQGNLRSGSILRGQVSRSALAELARSEAVLWIEEDRTMKLYDEVASKLVAGDAGPGRLLTQELGFDGLGVTVAVADSGLGNGDSDSMHPDLRGRTKAFFHYGTLDSAADEHSHGTHVAGIVAGNGATGETDENGALYGLGSAPGASIIAQRIFGAVGDYQAPPTSEKLTRDAVRAGADIGSNSWGDDTQGRYDLSAMEFDELVRDADGLALGDQPYILEFSAGNAGPGVQTIGSPAVGKNVLATGASCNDRPDFIIYADGPDTIADFSSRGPCDDGRIKPDLVAPGTWIASLQSSSATDQYAWAPISPMYQYQGGTSQAGPHASGAAAVFVQYYRQTHTNATPSPALVKAALINSATDLFFGGAAPNHEQGWGRIDLPALLDSPRTYDFVEQGTLLQTGDVFEKRVVIADPDEPFKATLAYTDVPGFPGAIGALVNDLDLEVVAPDGALYRGNQFLDGISVANALSADAVNNVEGVYLEQPQPGEYVVRVRARSVNRDARRDTPAIDQDFALVTSGVAPSPGVGALIFDRHAYTAPGLVKITLIDSDLAGQTSATIQLRSRTESVGETVNLRAVTGNGVLTGAVATVTGPAAPDGRLQIAHGDLIEALYVDTSAGSNAVATALGDLLPPQVTGVSSSNSFGQVIVSWSTSEPASGLIQYGTNSTPASLTTTAAARGLETSHSITLEDLLPGRSYWYRVVATDEAGNSATNDNNGALFTFTVPLGATVLLVDGYQDPFFDAPPLEGYLAALNQVGVSYDVWDVAERGATPTLSVMKPYRAVIWRLPEFLGGWSAADLSSISNYLASGGGLFVASMEVLSRVSETAPAYLLDVFKVQAFKTDETGSTGASQVVGQLNDPVGQGIDAFMDYAVYEQLWGGFLGPDLSDTLTPAPGAVSVLRNDAGDTVGLRWPANPDEAPGRLVLCTFPFDAVPLSASQNDRVQLLRNVLGFIAPGAPGLASLTFGSPAYTLPARASLQLGVAALAGQGRVQIQVSSTSDSTGISVTLLETAKPGVFSGSFDIVAATNAPAPGQLRAAPDDTLTALYPPAGGSGPALSATASIDIGAPSISGLSAEPEYEQALIIWETSEPADALVQFGESAILNRTAYDSSAGTTHLVTVPGLVPDRLYYYQVVSRDAAGNARTDDNNGKLHTFRTRMPLLPPWSDNLDSGAGDWSVYNVDDSQVGWRLGVPANGQVTTAHSPPNCWGSNLDGGIIDFVESFLISPAVYLTNGNTATLSFAHAYDFSESDGFELQFASLEIVAGNAQAPEVLVDFSGDLSGGWLEEEIDLTPYMGKVVYLLWHYVLFSLESTPRAGWLVDDVAITVAQVVPGTIIISNNLAQASYLLSGPVTQRGNGLGTTLSNAPPGQYTIEYADAPYYLTPATQTKSLAVGGTIQFDGAYTFPDTNQNAISDLWENALLGGTTNSVPGADSDGDGSSDYSEFVAGTDPVNPAKRLETSAQVVTGGSVSVEWEGVAGRSYRIVKNNGAAWEPLTEWISAGPVNRPLVRSVPAGALTSPTWLRVEVRP